MLEQVEQKIQELKKLQAEEFYKKKDTDLSTWGLTSKKNGKKSTPIIVTDDEYEALIKASNGVGKSGRNPVANTLKAFSVASIIVGVVAGATAWFSAKEMGFIWFSIAVLTGIVISLIFHGLSEAIRLLQQILDQKPLRRPDPLHTRVQQNQTIPTQPPVYMGSQPPIYQASSVPQPVPHPYYGAPVQTVPVQPAVPAQPPVQAPEEATAYGAPQNYNEMGAFERSTQM